MERCLEALDALERCRARGDLAGASAHLDAAIGAAPLALIPYLKLGRERFFQDACEMEPSGLRALRAWGFRSAVPRALRSTQNKTS